MFRSSVAGHGTASTASALPSRTAIQPGPLSAQAMSTMSDRATLSVLATCSATDSSTGPLRTSGGAANARPASVRRTVMRPASHSCTMAPGSAGRPPVSSQAWQVPSVGCPANGSSRVGVKIRTR